MPCQTSSARRRSISPRPPFAELARWRQQRQLSQEHEHAVGKQVAIARAEGALLAKEVGDDAVGGMLETQHAMHELGLRLEQGGRMHGADYPCRPETAPHSSRRRRANDSMIRPDSLAMSKSVGHLVAHRRLVVCAIAGVHRRRAVAGAG